jgi:cell wall-associated NlpC family hydrolase
MVAAEGLVNAVGVVLGMTRDSFGVGGAADAGFSSMSVSSPTFAAAVAGSGQTAAASSDQSAGLGSLCSALGEQDVAANANLQGALDSQGAGRGQMDDVIAGALGDVTGLSPGSNTSNGLQALVNALALRLEQAWQALTDGNTQASTQAAGSAQLAAGYNGLVSAPGGGVASTGSLSSMGGLSTGATQPAMTPMQVWIPASAAAASTAAASTAAQAASTQQAASTSPTTATLTSATKKTVPANVQTVLNRAKSELGKPYVWGGGNAHGPTGGGFDCSGLTLYAYAGAGINLPHNANAQMMGYGTIVPRSEIQPGDLIFCYFNEDGSAGPGHVQMATGYGTNSPVIEAPYTGANVQYSHIPSASELLAEKGQGWQCTTQVVVKRLLNN